VNVVIPVVAPVVTPQVENVVSEEEPFIKSSEPVAIENTEVQFSWDISTPTTPEPMAVTESEPAVEKVVRHILEDETTEKVNLDNVTAKTILSPEEQQRRTQERMSKIQEYTVKLKKAEGISEFENEPAYVRRNIQLDNSAKSSEERVSRFGLTEDENGTSLRNNNFLHDNVD
jgi:cell division protein FtsZ